MLHGLCGASTRRSRLRKKKVVEAKKSTRSFALQEDLLPKAAEGHLVVQMDSSSGDNQRPMATSELEHAPTLLSQVASWRYVAFVCFFCVNLFAQQWYSSTIQEQLYRLANGGSPTKWNTLYNILSNLGFVPKPLAGWLMKHPSGIVFCFIAGSLFSVLAIGSNLFHSFEIRTAGFVSLALGRCFVFSVFYYYASVGFSPAHYGTMVAIAMTIGFLVCLLQNPLQNFSVENGYNIVNIIFIAVLCLQFFLPGCLAWRLRRGKSITEFK